MTLAYSTRYVRYFPLVETSQFIIPFPLFGIGDLRVVVDGVDTELYSVSAAFTQGRAEGATISLTVPAWGVSVEIYGDRLPARTADYLPSSPNLARNLQNDVDVATALIQETRREQLRSIKVPPDFEGSTEIESAAPGSYIGFDADGNLTTFFPSGADTASLKPFQSVASSGQTVFPVPDHPVGQDLLMVFINGAAVNPPLYTEGPTSITLSFATEAGDVVHGWVLAYYGIPVPNLVSDAVEDDNYGTVEAGLKSAVHRLPPLPSFLWIGDSQPIPAQVETWRSGLDQMATHDVLEAWHIGDIVDEGTSETYGAAAYTFANFRADFFARVPLPPDALVAIPGNHDINYGNEGSMPASQLPDQFTYREYDKAFERSFYARQRGNLLTIHMGAMARNTGGNIPDFVVAWCREVVRRHQHLNIIILMHQPISGTFSTSAAGTQLGSERFNWINTDGHKVDLILSGHTEAENPWYLMAPAATNGTPCVNLDQNYSLGRIGFCVADFPRDVSEIRIRRYHLTTGVLNEAITVPLRWSNRLSEICQMDGRFDPTYQPCIEGPMEIYATVPRVYRSGDWLGQLGPTPLLRLRLEDRNNVDAEASMGAGITLDVPGANSGSASQNQENLNRASRPGAIVAAHRRGAAETAYAAGLGIWVNDGSSGGATTQALTQVMVVYEDYLQLFHSDYSIRMAGSDASLAGLNIAQDTGGVSAQFYPRGSGGAYGANGANAVLKLAQASTGRSLNAGGTVNTNGADYAEYLRKSDSMDGRSILPGSVAGLDVDGRLTDRWASVVSGFLVKSTEPGLVGGDVWGREDVICAKYGLVAAGDPPSENVDVATWRKRRTAIMVATEVERALWDRMAFAGQVPVKVSITVEDVGSWLVPVEAEGGGISASVVPDGDLTFAQSRISVGRIIARTAKASPASS
jgi:hypothetical protein